MGALRAGGAAMLKMAKVAEEEGGAGTKDMVVVMGQSWSSRHGGRCGSSSMGQAGNVTVHGYNRRCEQADSCSPGPAPLGTGRTLTFLETVHTCSAGR